MNAFRNLVTCFFASIVAIALVGWRWAACLPSPRLEAARTVLGLAASAALAGATLLWMYKPDAEP